MKKYFLEIVVFISGAAVMILELVGSRALAPYLGTSIFVWTSLIGIILGSLSLGYWWGGKVSDRKPEYWIFSTIIFMAAIWITGIAFLSDFTLILIESYVKDIRAASILASLILFAYPSMLLGMVSPYAVRLKIKDLNHSGQTVGSLYAISTVGSIVGTFLTGFVLLAYFGISAILLSLAIFLILASLIANASKFFKAKLVLILFLCLCVLASDTLGAILRGNDFIDANTAYNRIWVIDNQDSKIRTMFINNVTESAMYLNKNDLVYQYTKFYHLATHFNPQFKKCLMIGGGGYSYPKDFLKKYPKAQLDVVEIDPGLTALAKKYFKLKDNSRLTIYHEDGRTFLNRTTNKYDSIFIDAFQEVHAIPFQLASKEAARRMYDALNDQGVVIINIISAIGGAKGMFLRAEYWTFKSVFPQVHLFPVFNPGNDEILQNIILVALKSPVTPSFSNRDSELRKYLQHIWTKPIENDVPILTDDFAPIQRYAMKFIPPTYFNRRNPLLKRIRSELEKLGGTMNKNLGSSLGIKNVKNGVKS